MTKQRIELPEDVRDVPSVYQHYSDQWREFVRDWYANREPYNPRSRKSAADAEAAVEPRVGELFRRGFAPLADALVEAVGRERFKELYKLGRPPKREQVDYTDCALWLTGTGDTAKAGRRLLIWGARVNDYRKWRKGPSIPDRYVDWAMFHLVYRPPGFPKVEKGETPVVRGLNQWLDWIPRFLETVEERRARTAISSDGQSKQVSAIEPTAAAPEKGAKVASDRPTNFAGGASLTKALGIGEPQSGAFFKQLERKRHKFRSGTWQEVRDPPPRAPRYLYDANSSEIRNLAAKYNAPKLI